MQKLCKITLTIIIYFKSTNRHSVFLYNIRKRPFNMPYGFSHTKRALHSFLLKYFSLLSDLSSRKTFINQACFGKAVSNSYQGYFSMLSYIYHSVRNCTPSNYFLLNRGITLQPCLMGTSWGSDCTIQKFLIITR